MSAEFSPCRTWRYLLLRSIDGSESGPKIGFLLHNPSIAAEDEDDPTSKRGIGFSLRFGASMMAFLNPWAGVATDKRDLWRMEDPIGPENVAWIAQACQTIKESGGFWIVAWGKISPPRQRQAEASAHLRSIEAMIAATGCPMYALGVNNDGSPKHILYLKADAPLIPWPIREQSALDTLLTSYGAFR